MSALENKEDAEAFERLDNEITRLREELAAISTALNDPRTDLTMTMVEVIAELKAEVEALKADAASKQAKIDELMLEYCQEEMTSEQLDEYARHQISASVGECTAIDNAMQRKDGEE